MGSLKWALGVAGLLSLVYGVLLLIPSTVEPVFAYVPSDFGLLSLSASLFIGLGIITLAAATQADKVAGIAWAFAAGQLVGVVHLAWEYLANVYTLRTALVPAVLALLLAIWILMAKAEE